MSDAGDGVPPDDDGAAAREAARESVGSLGEEAVKLFGALSEWARDQGQEYAGTAAGATGLFEKVLHDVDEHVATGSADCRYCPVCQVIHAVRQTSPEVRTHLAVAASSLVNAAAGMLATRTESQPRPGVEKIDLDDGPESRPDGPDEGPDDGPDDGPGVGPDVGPGWGEDR